MEINDQVAYPHIEGSPQKLPDSSRHTTAATKTQGAPASSDKVVLSPKARELQDAKVQLDGLSDVDVQRVAQIQKQMDNGTYKIDGGKIAERMLREMHLNSGLWLR